MKTLLTALLLVGLAACADRERETGRVGGESADTSVVTKTSQDTMIVTSDTNVQTDTTVKEGGTRSRDTLNR